MFVGVGRALFTVAGLIAIFALRLDLRIERLGRKLERFGIEQPDMFAGWPWWLRMLMPESPFGWALIVMLAVLGVTMAKLGRWAEKNWR